MLLMDDNHPRHNFSWLPLIAHLQNNPVVHQPLWSYFGAID